MNFIIAKNNYSVPAKQQEETIGKEAYKQTSLTDKQ